MDKITLSIRNDESLEAAKALAKELAHQCQGYRLSFLISVTQEMENIFRSEAVFVLEASHSSSEASARHG